MAFKVSVHEPIVLLGPVRRRITVECGEASCLLLAAFKGRKSRAGEVVQRLRALTAHGEGQVLVPSTHRTTNNHLSLQFQEIQCSATASSGSLHACGAHNLTWCTHVNKMSKYQRGGREGYLRNILRECPPVDLKPPRLYLLMILVPSSSVTLKTKSSTYRLVGHFKLKLVNIGFISLWQIFGLFSCFFVVVQYFVCCLFFYVFEARQH